MQEGRPAARIMVVEDELIIAMDLVATLRDLGYTVVASVTKGEDAIRQASRVDAELILMDIRLAGELDGIETASHISSKQQVPIIFLTSHGDEETLRRATGAAPYGYILKPFKAAELRCAIEIAVHKHEIDLKLRAREQWLATTLRSIAEGVVATDAGDKVTLVNPVAEALTGWVEHEALGRRLDEILSMVDERDHAPIELPIQRTLGCIEPVVDQGLLLGKDGSTHLAAARSSPIVDEVGAVLGAVTVIRDITMQRAAEEEIRRLNGDLEKRVIERTRELEIANQELEAFSYSVAHDLRAPLRGIDGFSQVLIEEHAKNLGPEGVKHLERVIRAARRMNDLIDDLLRLSRLGRAELVRSEVDVSELARRAFYQLRVAEPRENVAVEIDDDLRVHADRRLLQILIENLVGNAWKFTSKQARSMIEVRRIAASDGPGFLVRDDGVGFDVAAANKLFGAFQRFHSGAAFAGSGIGLTIVQRIVHRHGGRVWAESAPGAGATFFVAIPEE